MKTKLILEIETRDITSDKLPVLEDEVGKDESELSEDSKEYRKEWVDKIHTQVVSHIKSYLENQFEEEFLDNLEEESVDGWDTLEDYGIKIVYKEE